jgi:hypothetical protein
MNNQREFLQLQQNHIADVTFKFSTGLKKEGQFGPYFLYSVVHEGKEKLLKATERLEKKLRELNIRQGQTLSLVKEVVYPKKGEPFTVINILESTASSHPVPRTQNGQRDNNPQPQPAKPAPAAQGQAAVAAVTPVAFTGDKQVMFQSLVDAVDITKAIGGIDWRNNDVEKIGVSLFLSRTGQLNAEQLLANGNGNGKRSRRIKKAEESTPPATAPEHVSVEAEKKNDLPF